MSSVDPSDIFGAESLEESAECGDPPRIDGFYHILPLNGNAIWCTCRRIRSNVISGILWLVVSPFIGEYQRGNSLEYPRVLEQTNSSLWKINNLYIITEIMGLHPSRTAYPTGPTLLTLHQFEVSGNHSQLATWICNCRVNWQFDVEHQSGYHWFLQGNHPFLRP